MNELANKARNYCTISQNQMLCFDLLKPEEYDLIKSKMLVIDYKAGEILCKQGSFASHIIIVREGLVKLYMESRNENLVIQILPPNNLIGLSSCFVGSSVFNYSAQAYMDTTAQLIDMGVIMEIINSNAQFAAKMLSLLAEHTLIIYGRFYCFTRKQTYGRFADILLCLANRIYKSTKFPLQLSRKELAELSDMSVESIARILTRFKHDKLINITSDYVELLDVERLTEISQKG